jgi:HPt (histidine-containing phosphotransfer) domain-containing protein
VGHNLPLYHRLLGRFAAEWADVVARLGPLLAGGHIGEARRLCHTLKGTAATLGIDGVSAKAASIEAALGLADPGPLAPSLQRLEVSLAEACAAIAAVVGEPTAGVVVEPTAGVVVGPGVAGAPAASAPAQPVLAAIIELEALLGRRNLRAREAADRLRNTPLPAHCQAPLDDVVGKVARLDYAEAAVALAELKALLSAPASEMHQ